MAASIELTINVVFGTRRWTVLRNEPSRAWLIDVIQAVLDGEEIKATVRDCMVVCEGKELAIGSTVGDAIGPDRAAASLWIHIRPPGLRSDALESYAAESDEDEEDQSYTQPPASAMRMRLPPAPVPAPASIAARSHPPMARYDEAPSTAARPASDTRHIAVRYYERMNPERVFPFLVVLSAKEIQKVVQKHVAQKSSGPVTIETDRTLEIEPVLPGCSCYPPRASILPDDKDQTIRFWVVPEVLGTIPGTTVRVSQGGKLLSEIDIDMRVCRQTMAKIAGVATLTLPIFSAVAKHYRIDFASQMQDGFGLYLSALDTIIQHLSTPVLFGGLALLTLVLYLVSRPKKRDVFFDVTPEA